MKITTYFSQAEAINFVERIYETFFKFANDPKLFDNMELITKINMLHMHVATQLNYLSKMPRFGNEPRCNIDYK